MFEMPDLATAVFLAIMGFVASFIDSVVGGGGLISTPALLWAGLPPITTLATNKVAATMGSLTSFVQFVRSGKMDTELIKKLFPISFMGSVLGVFAVRMVPLRAASAA